MFGWIDDGFRLLFYVVMCLVFVVASVFVVRFTIVVYVNTDESLFWGMWTSDEMYDFSNGDYWREAILWTLAGCGVLIFVVFGIACFGSCWRTAGGVPLPRLCCGSSSSSQAHTLPPPPSVSTTMPPIQLVMNPPPQQTSMESVV